MLVHSHQLLALQLTMQAAEVVFLLMLLTFRQVVQVEAVMVVTLTLLFKTPFQEALTQAVAVAVVVAVPLAPLAVLV